jgi:hypothetical protein
VNALVPRGTQSETFATYLSPSVLESEARFPTGRDLQLSDRDKLIIELDRLWQSLGDDLIEMDDEKLTPVMRRQTRSNALRKLSEGNQILRQLRSE